MWQVLYDHHVYLVGVGTRLFGGGPAACTGLCLVVGLVVDLGAPGLGTVICEPHWLQRTFCLALCPRTVRMARHFRFGQIRCTTLELIRKSPRSAEISHRSWTHRSSNLICVQGSGGLKLAPAGPDEMVRLYQL